MLEKENFTFRKRGIMAKRKGYATPEQQAQANKRYYESNEEAVLKRRIRNYRSSGKTFILNYASETDLKEYEGYIKARRKELEEGSQ